MNEKDLFIYWQAVEATCKYLRKHHARENWLGYNSEHPLALAVMEMWLYQFNED